MSHTPGPWEYDPDRNDQIVKAGRYQVAILPSIPNEDNGYLMAAAPDLLEAAIELHGKILFGHGEIQHRAGTMPDICAACHAIAKARGDL